ncbi:MAG TPA: hypothetical protein PLZ27_04015 [Bacillota bacterium]|nr:hypothetical protein [Clostridiales bacterium]HPU17819.1 hypothetical protein [Bacillota bacterium]
MNTYNYGFSSRARSMGRIQSDDKSKININAKNKEHSNNNTSFATTALLMMLTVLISYAAGTLTDLAGSAADVSGIYRFTDESASAGDDNVAVYAMSGGVDGIDGIDGINEANYMNDDYYDDDIHGSPFTPNGNSISDAESTARIAELAHIYIEEYMQSINGTGDGLLP